MKRFEYRQTHWFPPAREELWAILEQFDHYETWWVWLRAFSADRAGLSTGNSLHGVVLPPVPYQLHLDVALVECRRPHLVRATVSGDVAGWAELRLVEADEGTDVIAEWSLEMATTPLRIAAQVAYPVMRWAHDRVVDVAVSSFRRRALSSADASTRSA